MATFTPKPAGNLLRAKSVAIIGASQKALGRKAFIEI